MTDNREDIIDDEEIVYNINNSLENTGSTLSESDLHGENEKMNIPTCSICLRNYNLIRRNPMVLVSCGHSVCSECLIRIIKCPICRLDIEDTIINWAINSELSSKTPYKISPFYKIFIDLKRDIENDYLRYPDTPYDADYDTLTQSQMKLINKIKFRIKDIEVKDHMIDNLLIPLWIKQQVKATLSIIQNYKYRMVYFGLAEIEDMLPFCP